MQKMIREAVLILLTATVLSLFAWLFAPPPRLPAAIAAVPFQEIDRETLSLILKHDPHLLLDARPGDSYIEGHIPGAVSMPAYEIEDDYPRLNHLFQPDLTVIVYCSYVECHDADVLAEELARRGVSDILLYRGGFADWNEADHPVTRGDRP